MPKFEAQSEMPVPAKELYDWHMEPGAFEKLTPPWQKVRILEEPDSLHEGALPEAMQRGMSSLLGNGKAHLQAADQEPPPHPGFSTHRLRDAYDDLTEVHRRWTDGVDINTISAAVATLAYKRPTNGLQTAYKRTEVSASARKSARNPRFASRRHLHYSCSR